MQEKKKSDNRIRKTAGKEKVLGVGQENHGTEQMGQRKCLSCTVLIFF